MRSNTLVISASCAVAVIAAGMLAADPPVKVVVKLPYEQHQARGGHGSTTITYHGGAVMTQGVNVYVIYYGMFAPATATVPTSETVVNQFFSDLSSSPEYAVNQTYYDANSATIHATFKFNPIDYDSFTSPTGSLYHDTAPSLGNSVGSSTVPAIISNAIGASKLPADEKGVYFVVTGPGVKVSGFCKSFCAYHTSTTISGTRIRYALVPDPGQACTGCDGNFFLGQNVTPNGNRGADEMTDSMIHELSETVTDPDLKAWYTSSGAENGDLCNYVYGSIPPGQIVPKGLPGAGASYNFKSITNHYYLIQQIWSNATTPQACLGTP